MYIEVRDKIRELIPRRLAEFPKLESSGEPYRFYKWDYDKNGYLCLYYIVTGGKKEYSKRIPIEEIESAIIRFLKTGKFDREDYRELCPIANRDGPCGFAIIGRILEVLYGARYEGRSKGFRKSSL